MGTKIKDAQLLESVTGAERIPVSDGSGNPKAVTTEALKNFVGVGSSGGGGGMIEITYAELKSLRDNGKLIPGQMYRMTDYETTTIQANTSSAGHPFDLVLTALDERTLDEKCTAMQSKRDADGYFAESDLLAWQVWYCLDNDGKFSWAMRKSSSIIVDVSSLDAGVSTVNASLNGTIEYNNVTYSKWDTVLMGIEVSFLTTSDDVSIGDVPKLYLGGYAMDTGTITSVVKNEKDGYGVIYRIIDERQNDLPYDFKNILFKVKITSGVLDLENGTESFVYTFNKHSNNINSDLSISSLCSGNSMYPMTQLPNNVFLTNQSFMSIQNNKFGYACTDNILGGQCVNNTFKSNCNLNTFGIGCLNNVFGDSVFSNVFGNNFENNVFLGLSSNNVFDRNANGNQFGLMFSSNVVGKDFLNNTFEDECSSNTFGNTCSHNSFGYQFQNNTFGNEIIKNKFGKYCNNNTFNGGCSDCNFGSNCENNLFNNRCSRNQIAGHFWDNTVNGDFLYNTIGSDFINSTFWGSFFFGVIEPCCHDINFGTETNELHCEGVKIRHSSMYLNLINSDTGAAVYNYDINIGTHNYSTIEVPLVPGRKFYTYIRVNDDGALFEYTDKDIFNLINSSNPS